MKKGNVVLPSTHAVFRVMQQMTERAAASWAIWFGLHAQQEGGGPYAMVLQLYRPFFGAIYDAQIHFTILALSDLFGKRGDVHSFQFLIARCLEERRISPCKAAVYKKKLSSLAPARRGIGILRGKHFGHKLLSAPISQVLREARLKIRDIDEVLDAAFWLLGRLAFACGEAHFQGNEEDDEQASKTLDEALKYFLGKWENLGKGGNPSGD
jgi:hypothetical protein